MGTIIGPVGRAGIRLLFILLIGTIPTNVAGQAIDIDRIGKTLESGPWAGVSGRLADVYDEYQAYLQKGGFATLQEAFKPTNRMAPVVDGLIVIDAIAEGDPEALLADLEALGLQNGATFGAMVSGRRNIANEKADRMAAVVGAVRESIRKTLPYVRYLRAFRLRPLGRIASW